MITYFNGTFVPKDDVRVSPDDRGFLFGDGVYEVARTYGGKLFALDRHLARLRYSLDQLRIRGTDVDRLGDVCRELLRQNDLGSRDAVVYLQVTRGAAPRTHAFPSPAVGPTVYGYAAPITPKFDPGKGVAAITVPDTRWARCDIKSVSLVANCLANQQAAEAGVFEAIFVRDGVALEGSHTSFFAVIGGEVRTVPLTNYVLPGITRGVVLELCRSNGIPAKEAPIFAHQLNQAEELFLAGTTTEVLAAVQLDGRAVAGGRPGPITSRLRELFCTFSSGPAE
ncbi:MAG: D-amino acid aminotransferase [Gemmatimonadetes bacterium]|nr:D-amino acid aminotransferase [Gemmatimonadota bacterium]